MSKETKKPYLAVPTDFGHEVRQRLLELELLDEGSKMVATKSKVYFPLRKKINAGRLFPDMDRREWSSGSREFIPVESTKKIEKKTKKKKRRTLVERAESIFKFIDSQPESFPKSDLQKIGFNPSTAESWLHLIEYIQSQPRIKVTKLGAQTYIEKLENKYLSMLRKRILDSSLSIKERSKTMDDYIGALVTLEKIEDGRIKK